MYLVLIIIALIACIITMTFLIGELNDSWNNIQAIHMDMGREIDATPWHWRLVRMPVLLLSYPFRVLLASSTFVMDVCLTLFVVWLFSMAGMTGMLMSMIASGMISLFLLIKRRKKQ